MSEIQRIKKVIAELKRDGVISTNKDIAEAMGYTRQGTVSDNLKKEPLDDKFLAVFCTKFNIPLSKIRSNVNYTTNETVDTVNEDSIDYSNSIQKALQYRISLKENKRPVPVMNVKAAAGTIALIQDEPELIVEYLDVPFVGMVDGAIEVVGESMLPTLSPGARAAVKKLEDKTLLNWGEVYYVIDSNYEGYIKRLYPGSDESHITLRSDNPNPTLYPPIARKWEHIIAIFKVKADITKH